jgi:hypothetical protein
MRAYSGRMRTQELWVESYQGEVLGEAFFGLLAECESDPGRRRQLEVLTLLERETKKIAEPVFERHGFDRGDLAGSVSIGRQLAQGFADLSWEEMLGSIGPVTVTFLAKYRELVDLCTDDADRQIAEAYVAHEEALAAFARRALGTEEGDPLELILELPHVRAKITV